MFNVKVDVWHLFSNKQKNSTNTLCELDFLEHFSHEAQFHTTLHQPSRKTTRANAWPSDYQLTSLVCSCALD